MSNLTKPGYKNGYEAARENLPSTSPHRSGTVAEDIWIEGYNAYVMGGEPPKEPREYAIKDESTYKMPLSMMIKIPGKDKLKAPVKTGPTLLEKIFTTKDEMKTETDSEILELLHMDLADFEWQLTASDGPKPSTVWEEYKAEHKLNFDKTAA